MRHLRLGASLYVPATRRDLIEIAARRKFGNLRSVILCTEDSIRSEDLPLALDQLDRTLAVINKGDLLTFIRVRNPEVLRTILSMPYVNNLDGFVLPKITTANLETYLSAFTALDRFDLMMTLETVDAFEQGKMVALRNALASSPHRGRILALRIGGNDLLNLLSIRRPRSTTIYGTSLGLTIAQLANTFLPYDFHLTGPVFEYLDLPRLLSREVRRDLRQGLFGKTAIHPAQVAVIEACYSVTASDVEVAEAVVSQHAPAVFQMHNSMCEPSVHRRWATTLLERAAIYGVVAKSTTSIG